MVKLIRLRGIICLPDLPQLSSCQNEFNIYLCRQTVYKRVAGSGIWQVTPLSCFSIITAGAGSWADVIKIRCLRKQCYCAGLQLDGKVWKRESGNDPPKPYPATLVYRRSHRDLLEWHACRHTICYFYFDVFLADARKETRLLRPFPDSPSPTVLPYQRDILSMWARQQTSRRGFC